jgi:hypothetical protein
VPVRLLRATFGRALLGRYGTQTTNSTFLSEQISHQQTASSTFLSEQISTSHQPLAKRTGLHLPSFLSFNSKKVAAWFLSGEEGKIILNLLPLTLTKKLL